MMGHCLQCHAFEGHFKCCKYYVEAPEAEKIVKVQFSWGSVGLTRAQLVAGLKDLDEAEPPKPEFKAGDRVRFHAFHNNPNEYIVLSTGAHEVLAKGLGSNLQSNEVAIVDVVRGHLNIAAKTLLVKVNKP